MLWVYAFVVVTSMLILYVPFSLAMGRPAYPLWVVELLFGFYWFSYVFRGINQKFFDVTRKQSYIDDLRPLFGYALMTHIILAYLLSFAVLPFFVNNWGIRLLIAYVGSYVFTVAIPIAFANFYYPRYLKKQEGEQLSANRIREIARNADEAERFVRTFPQVRTYVYDHARKNRIARCVFLFRRVRPEREGLSEDLTLEVPVDMERMQPLAEETKVEHYLFLTCEGQSAVYHLPAEKDLRSHLSTAPLDEETLNQLDYQAFRFRSLDEIPFALANRNVPFEKL